MIDKIKTPNQYDKVMALIESYLQKASNKGGFDGLSQSDTNELKRLSLLAEQYEDEVLKIMPISTH